VDFAIVPRMEKLTHPVVLAALGGLLLTTLGVLAVRLLVG
jgi:hypothetical protein